MRNILGLGLALTAACLVGTSGTARGQAGGPATVGGGVANTPATLGQQAVATGTAAVTSAAPGATSAVPRVQTVMPNGNPAAMTGGVMSSTTPNAYQATATNVMPGSGGRAMSGMTGYNAVNPMATTMPPGTYYAGAGGRPYAAYSPQVYGGATMPYTNGATTVYPAGYAYPGYNTTQTQPYTMQRRGLFGRRNRMVYPANPYGATTYTYGSYPSGYTSATTTYYATPGSYSYGTYPY